MAQTEMTSPPAFSETKERKMIFLLCTLAAIHVFIFSASFPLINCVDEQAHFDLVVKYSHGHAPRGLEPISRESMQYIVIYASQEFNWPPEVFPGKKIPTPPWKQPPDKTLPLFLDREAAWQRANYESTQPPLYYALAGLWWHLGQWLGFDGGHLLYWLRFLDVLFVAVLVWIAHAAAREIFPENLFLRLGVPALIAFIPQTSLYSIQNDVLSPLCFGAAFICLVKLSCAEIPDVRLGMFTGLALAATFLTKMANIPLLVVGFTVVFLKIMRLAKSGKLHASIPSLASLFFCAGLPMAAWMAWCKINFGDLTGSAPKVHILTWTIKPFAGWWHHPIFTPQGLGTFLSKLTSSFWQTDFTWHGQALGLPWVDTAYVAASIILVGVALLNLLPASKSGSARQRQALLLGFGCFAASIAFLGFLSIIYDFHGCFYPSRAYPYFTSGRLMLGALIPFMLLFVFGLDRALNRFGLPAKFFALAAMVLFMLISEIAIDWPVFSSQYNWFHM